MERDKLKKSKHFGKILVSYLKERVALLLGCAVIILIFFLISSLYGYENAMRNMWYAVILACFFALLICILDFFRYLKKCCYLLEALSRTGETDYFLPEAKNYPEQLYQELIAESERQKRNLISELDHKKKDMADYYTLWTHQIKTPIAAMRLLFQQEEVSRQAQEELFKIEQYSEMALGYARLNSISSDLVLEEYNIYDILKQAVKKYSILFIGSGLSFSLEEFRAYAVTDEKWLCFVIEQLLSNALKYTKEGEIKIYAEGKNTAGRYEKTEETLYASQGFVLVIEDTGIGINEKDLPRIFERGFTGYNGRMDKKSTGIGLYLCREICSRLSHPIAVSAKAGEGTQVRIEFYQETAE